MIARWWVRMLADSVGFGYVHSKVLRSMDVGDLLVWVGGWVVNFMGMDG